ncbi:AAA family ATPase [Streptomyces sp. NPDC090106]|uniref:AAA family ATPase n=1 Tax=Streptomyces sp. NPDC090106 TaxID=3365946 RepID=UPI0037FACEB5
MIVERAYAHAAEAETGAGDWPWSVPCVRQLLDEGLRFTAPVTFLVGENGSGKSTLVEALAEGFGLDPWGGSAGYRYAGPRAPSVLGGRIRFEAGAAGRRMLRGPHTRRRGFFLRAETALDALGREERTGRVSGSPEEMSHGEGFLMAFRERFAEPGLYVLDEPESALSFASCLELVLTFDALSRTGAQIICATHSPLLTALPGADVLEVGAHGIRRTEWRDLELVDHWRRYLDDPWSYLRHLMDRP